MDRSVTRIHQRIPAGHAAIPRTISAREAGVIRTRRIRTYPQGNLRERVARCESLKELQEAVKVIGQAVAAGTVSLSTARKVQKTVDARRVELEGRQIVVPGSPGRRTKSGLYLP